MALRVPVMTGGQEPAPAKAGVGCASCTGGDWDKATLTDRARQIIREAADNSTKVKHPHRGERLHR
jgi:hypothetical protein